jgi:hypothetical protein
MLPPAHSLAWHGSGAWLALVSVINLPGPAVPINHTYKFSYNDYIKPKSFYTCLTLWAHDTLHIHIYELLILFLFFLPATRQGSWPRPLITPFIQTSSSSTQPFSSSTRFFSFSTYLVLSPPQPNPSPSLSSTSHAPPSSSPPSTGSYSCLPVLLLSTSFSSTQSFTNSTQSISFVSLLFFSYT